MHLNASNKSSLINTHSNKHKKEMLINNVSIQSITVLTVYNKWFQEYICS